jgi:hypothetical protein
LEQFREKGCIEVIENLPTYTFIPFNIDKSDSFDDEYPVIEMTTTMDIGDMSDSPNKTPSSSLAKFLGDDSIMST